VEGFVRGVLELGDAEAQLGRSEKTPDGLTDYLMLRYRGVRRHGAAVYVTPRTGRVNFRLPAGAAAL
jgi:hypothetical protein